MRQSFILATSYDKILSGWCHILVDYQVDSSAIEIDFLNKVSDLNFVKKNIIQRKNSKQNKSNFLIEINHQ